MNVDFGGHFYATQGAVSRSRRRHEGDPRQQGRRGEGDDPTDRHPVRAAAPGPARAAPPRPRPGGRAGRRGDPLDRLRPPRAREAGREAGLQGLRLHRRADLRDLQVHPRHDLLQGDRGDHGRRGPAAGALPPDDLVASSPSPLATCCGSACSRTRSGSRSSSCTPGGSASISSTIMEATTGGRVIQGVCKVGGVRRDISDETLRRDRGRDSTHSGRDVDDLVNVFVHDDSVNHRLKGVGVLHGEQAYDARGGRPGAAGGAGSPSTSGRSGTRPTTSSASSPSSRRPATATPGAGPCEGDLHLDRPDPAGGRQDA